MPQFSGPFHDVNNVSILSAVVAGERMVFVFNQGKGSRLTRRSAAEQLPCCVLDFPILCIDGGFFEAVLRPRIRAAHVAE